MSNLNTDQINCLYQLNLVLASMQEILECYTDGITTKQAKDIAQCEATLANIANALEDLDNEDTNNA